MKNKYVVKLVWCSDKGSPMATRYAQRRTAQHPSLIAEDLAFATRFATEAAALEWARQTFSGDQRLDHHEARIRGVEVCEVAPVISWTEHRTCRSFMLTVIPA